MRHRYFFYNTDLGALDGKSRLDVLFDQDVAVTGGHHQFSSQLEQLEVDDVLIMYENGLGMVGVGRVKKPWNHRIYRKCIYYPFDEGSEARVSVAWFIRLSSSPISLDAIRGYFKTQFTPRGTIRRIRRHVDALQACLADCADASLPDSTASDTEFVLPARTKSVVSRIVRDGEVAKRVKRWNRNLCQLCNKTVRGPNGERYSEAHHIRPLGNNHCGLDCEGNVLCVCPTCHAKLDLGFVRLVSARLIRRDPRHQIDKSSIEYHNEVIYRK